MTTPSRAERVAGLMAEFNETIHDWDWEERSALAARILAFVEGEVVGAYHRDGLLRTMELENAGLRDALRERTAEVEGQERELERWRHGKQIEGDYVCPHGLSRGIAEAERDAALAELKTLRARLVVQQADADAVAKAFFARRHELEGDLRAALANVARLRAAGTALRTKMIALDRKLSSVFAIAANHGFRWPEGDDYAWKKECDALDEALSTPTASP